jgi:hypothetical protein
MVNVQLTDIFDVVSELKPKTTLEYRLEYAFGSDGKDFWDSFFPCDAFHPDDRIVYLFTEYQMKFIWDWWHSKYFSGTDDIRKNLDYSKQKMSQAVTTSSGYSTDRIRACYLKPNSSYGYELVRVFFGIPPDVKKDKSYVDFFDWKFNGKSLKNSTDESRRTILLNLLKTRSLIEKEFDGPQKKDKKWLCYLGPKLYDNKAIKYCSDCNTCCPLV